MIASPFYHQTIKKVVIGFGRLFSDIRVIRYNADGTVGQVVKVPLAYGPKEKIIQRADQDADMDNQIYATLPRMAFEVLGYNYDPSRKVNRNNKISCADESGIAYTYSPVPYNINIQLSLLTKGTEDSLAVLEQILPTFTPEYTLAFKAVPELNVTSNVPIVLEGVSVSDEYEGGFDQRRIVTHTFDFVAKVDLFGGVRKAGMILHAEANVPNQMTQYDVIANDTRMIILDEWSTL